MIETYHLMHSDKLAISHDQNEALSLDAFSNMIKMGQCDWMLFLHDHNEPEGLVVLFVQFRQFS